MSQTIINVEIRASKLGGSCFRPTSAVVTSQENEELFDGSAVGKSCSRKWLVSDKLLVEDGVVSLTMIVCVSSTLGETFCIVCVS